MLGEEEEEAFSVWPANERALSAFLSVCRQWRVGGMGGVLGFDMQQVESVLRMRKIKVDAELLDDLAVMESGVMEVWNAK